MAQWTTEQVIALAPDPASAKAGQGLSNPGKWSRLEQDARSLWGEIQGSGKDPYRTQVDLTGPAFHCSCPSRKFPCKHGLGLMLIFAGKPQNVKQAEPPAWVKEWLEKREAAADRKAAKAEAEAAPVDPEAAAKKEAEREKRASKREERVRDGFADLQTWLNDVIRQGLAHAQQQPAQYWDGMAARMIDCQAPGVARVLRQIPGLLVSGDGWADRTLEQLGILQWLLHGHRRLDALPPALRQDVRTAVGWTVSEQELASVPAVSDRWQIVGQTVEDEDRLRVQRTWLFGERSRQPALNLSFSAGGQPLDVSLVPGNSVDADLSFYPSNVPLRAVVKQRRGEPARIEEPAAVNDFQEALDATATLIAGNPWLERFPWLVRDCSLARSGDRWLLVDARGASVSIASRFQEAWTLAAVSGGQPVTVFGEWNGSALLPLSVFADGRMIRFGGAAE